MSCSSASTAVHPISPTAKRDGHVCGYRLQANACLPTDGRTLYFSLQSSSGLGPGGTPLIYTARRYPLSNNDLSEDWRLTVDEGGVHVVTWTRGPKGLRRTGTWVGAAAEPNASILLQAHPGDTLPLPDCVVLVPVEEPCGTFTPPQNDPFFCVKYARAWRLTAGPWPTYTYGWPIQPQAWFQVDYIEDQIPNGDGTYRTPHNVPYDQYGLNGLAATRQAAFASIGWNGPSSSGPRVANRKAFSDTPPARLFRSAWLHQNLGDQPVDRGCGPQAGCSEAPPCAAFLATQQAGQIAQVETSHLITNSSQACSPPPGSCNTTLTHTHFVRSGDDTAASAGNGLLPPHLTRPEYSGGCFDEPPYCGSRDEVWHDIRHVVETTMLRDDGQFGPGTDYPRTVRTVYADGREADGAPVYDECGNPPVEVQFEIAYDPQSCGSTPATLYTTTVPIASPMPIVFEPIY